MFKTVSTKKLLDTLNVLETIHFSQKTKSDRDIIFSIKYELKQRGIKTIARFDSKQHEEYKAIRGIVKPTIGRF